MVVEQEHADDQPIWSSEINKALVNFGMAIKGRAVDDVKRAAKGVVDAASAYYRMSGVPTFAHDPVQPLLVKAALPPEHLAPR